MTAMRLLPFSCGRALLCLFVLSSFAAAHASDRVRRQETSPSGSSTAPATDNGETTTLLPTSSASLDDITATASVSPSSSLPASSSLPPPRPTDDANATIFNATPPKGQLPLAPKITPGWAVAGTILLITGLIHALTSTTAKRLHTFFNAAFLAALGTTVLILYLMTPPVTLAVQGAFVVAAVCTGAVLGGLAVLFEDIAECLGCLLGGFCLSMWLLTLRPNGLVESASGKVVFIAAFSVVAFCLYFSRWTRTYGLVVSVSFSGATAAVLGIDCFSRAGLKEFWAFIWAVNEGLFPDGADTYPLARGIRVELAVTILLSVAGVISQLKLWRLVQKRRNKVKDESRDEEMGVPDEEENIGRRVEEMTNRERREWERVYGDGGSSREGLTDSAVGDGESEKPHRRSKGTSTTSVTEIQSPIEGPDGEVLSERREGTSRGLEIIEKDAAGGRVIVRVVEDDAQEGAADDPPQEKDEGKEEGPCEDSAAPKPGHDSHPMPEPPIVPLPFKIPEARDDKEGASVAESVEQEDGSSVAAVADDEDEPGDLARDDNAEAAAWLSRNKVRYSGSTSQNPGSGLDDGKGAKEVFGPVALPAGLTRDDSDSVVATLDDQSISGDADTAILDWSPGPAEGSVKGAGKTENPKESETLNESTAVPDTSAGESPNQTANLSVLEPESHMTKTPPSTTEEPTEATGTVEEVKQEEVTAPGEVAPLDSGDTSFSGPESAVSYRTMVARLTKLNLPSALPDVALTYRTNEWAKHLSIAETPEPDSLQPPETIEEVSDEQPARLDVEELQRTAENGAPPPAAPRTSSAMPHHPRSYSVSKSVSRTSLSGLETAGAAPTAAAPDSQPAYRPVHYRSSSALRTRQSSGLLADIIAEEGGELRSFAEVQRLEADPARSLSPTANPHPSTSMSTPNLLQSSTGMYTSTKPATLIGMRERLLRSRTSGIFTPINNEVVHNPTDPTSGGYTPSDAGSIRNYPMNSPTSQPRSSADLDLDDIPLSQRRALMRHSSLPHVPGPTPTAETITFDSHQPTRHSSLPPASVRQAQLANFRSSVAADLRATTPAPIFSGPQHQRSASNGRLSSTSLSLSTPNLLTTTTVPNGNTHPQGAAAMMATENKAEALRTMELQRAILLSQRESEAQRKGAERAERERYQREFEERMRSGALMGAHRDAMRRLQGGVKG